MSRPGPPRWHPGGAGRGAGSGHWEVGRWDDVMAVSTDSSTWSSTEGVLLMEIGLHYDSPPTILHTDPPDHTRYRALVQPAFAPSAMRALRTSIGHRAREYVERIEPGTPIDVVPAVAVPFPLRIIADLLGVPSQDTDRFHHWSETMIPGALDLSPEERAAAGVEMHDYFAAVIERRRADPRDDVISRLTAVEVDGEQLNDDELFMFLNQLLVAGNETTRNTISGGLVALAERPSEWQRLRDDPSLVPSAVEEIIRWTTAVISFMRTATTDTTLGGVEIGRGDHVLMRYDVANRDEAQFGPTAERFDVTRSPNHHLAFGFGAHYCIGALLARIEVAAVLECALDRFTGLELAGPVERSPSEVIAGVTSAPMVFRD